MSNKTEAGPIPTDPMKTWREWFVKNERDWSQAMTNLMKEESVARTLGQEINAAIHRQQMFTQGMAGPMASMNMPSRSDVMALGDRIGQLEDAVARVEAALVRIEARNAPATPRTRVAPKAAPAAPAAPAKKAPARRSGKA